jgi:ketosteroid isomerase-like protein
MKSLRLLSALLLASTALLLGCHTRENAASSDAEIHQWMDNFKHAFEAKDTNAVMALYTPDILAYDVIPPLQYVGSDAYTKDWNTFFSGFQGSPTLEFRDCHINSSGDLAIVTCLEHVSGTMTNGQPSSVWLRATSGLRRVNGQWLDFHDHVSVPADFTTSQAKFDLTP